MGRLLRVLAAASAGLMALAVLGQPAHAGGGYPACGPICDGKDPATYQIKTTTPYYHCADAGLATTVDYVQYGTWRLELRYSNRCETTWGRLIDLQNGSALPRDIRHISRNPDGTIRKSEKNRRVSGTNWTTMLDDHNLYNRVCLDVYADEFDYADGIVEWTACTIQY